MDYFYLDSKYRDLTRYRNPCEFFITPEIHKGYFVRSRTMQNPSEGKVITGITSINEVESSVSLKTLVIPYIESVTDNLPVILLDVRSKRYMRDQMIRTNSTKLDNAIFICNYLRTKNDSAGEPKWLIYESSQIQVMRLARHEELYVRLFNRNGNTIVINDGSSEIVPGNDDLQIMINIELLPFSRDNNFLQHSFIDRTHM